MRQEEWKNQTNTCHASIGYEKKTWRISGSAPLSLSRKNPGTSLCRVSIFVLNPNPFLHFSLYIVHLPFFFPSTSQPLEPQLQISQTLELIISSHLISFNLIYLPPQISRYFSTVHFRYTILRFDEFCNSLNWVFYLVNLSYDLWGLFF